MKKFLLVLLLVSSPVFAENYTLRFDQVPVVQLLQATYKNLLGKSYGLDASVITNARKVTLDVVDLPADRLAPTVDAVLRQAGIFKNVTADGVVFFTSSKDGLNVEEPTAPDQENFQDVPSYESYDLPSVPVGVVQMVGEPGAQLPAFPPGQIPENFTLYRPNQRPTSVLQPIANQLLGVNYPVGDFVFMSGPLKSIEKTRFLLEQLDQAPSEIFARALILEFTNGSTEGNTFEFALSALSGKLKIGMGSLLPLGENFVKIGSTDFTAILSAVSGDTRFNVVNAPTLRIKDGATGRLNVGEEVPTLSSTTLDNQGNAQQSIQYRSSGVIFELKPTILKKRIELDLRQQISDFAKTSTSGIDSPTLTKRELQTVISVDPGELVILGGLDQNRDTDVRRGFSFLPKFMQGHASDKTNTQVLVVLQVQRVI
ncbi:Type II secretion system protein D precursor [compost metagenome]